MMTRMIIIVKFKTFLIIRVPVDMAAVICLICSQILLRVVSHFNFYKSKSGKVKWNYVWPKSAIVFHEHTWFGCYFFNKYSMYMYMLTHVPYRHTPTTMNIYSRLVERY